MSVYRKYIQRSSVLEHLEHYQVHSLIPLLETYFAEKKPFQTNSSVMVAHSADHLSISEAS